MRPVTPRLLTVDVWDTLLRRRCHPDAVKLHTAQELRLRYADSLRGADDARSLLALRLQVERDQARTTQRDPSRDDEYALDTVLAEWIDRACSVSAQQCAAMVAVLRTEELAHEAFVSYADPDIRALLDAQPADQRLFLSDFYASAGDVKTLLERHGFADYFSAGHTSADQQLNKRSGRLYQRVQTLQGVLPEAHLHIGDNPKVDVQTPRRLGMSARHYHHRAEEKLRRQRGRWLSDRAALFRSIEADLFKVSPQGLRAEAAEAFRCGQRLAPLFAGFALFMLESARRDRVDGLYFLTREGEFLIRCYQQLLAADPRLADQAPEARVLAVSRMSTFAASRDAPSVAAMMPLWRGFPGQSIRAWSVSLGLEAGSAVQLHLLGLAQAQGLSADEPLDPIWSDPRLLRLLGDADCQALLREHIEGRRAEALAYLQASGVAECARVGIVDIGWRGSIQDHLAALLPQQSFRGYYLGLQAGLSPSSAQVRKTSFGPDLNTHVDEGTRRLRLFRNLPLLELLAYAPGGSVTAYRRAADGSVLPLRDDTSINDARYVERLGSLQDGILQGVSTWAPYLRDQAVSSEECRELALQRWSQLLRRPPRALQLALNELIHDERFGRGVVGPAPVPRKRWFERFGR